MALPVHQPVSELIAQTVEEPRDPFPYRFLATYADIPVVRTYFPVTRTAVEDMINNPRCVIKPSNLLLRH